MTFPPLAVEHYEALRARVLGGGHCRTGVTAFLYHGMARGLALMAAKPPTPTVARQGTPASAMADMACDSALVSRVAMGQVGVVLGLEVSRLARNNADWHRLIELAALSGTLIVDEDGLYDPVQFNDRLLPGLKGTMSEAELHVLNARLQGGIRNKARRGELPLPLPIGLVYRADGKIELDPDQRITQARFLTPFVRRVPPWRS